MKISNSIKFKIISFFLISFSLSCVREEIVPFDGSDKKSKLVVYGFLTPGNRVSVYVGKSQPFGNGNYNAVDFIELKATVFITDQNGRSQALLLENTLEPVYSCSQNDFPIVSGMTYYLKVSANSLIDVTAKTTVPRTVTEWDKAFLIGPENYYYYSFSGFWNKASNAEQVDYGVSIATGNANFVDRTNEGITFLNDFYTVKRDVYMANVSRIEAILITRDRYFSDFSRKTDLTLDLVENLSSSAFTDIISSYKGVIPDAGNIQNGVGVFGSYLKDVRTIYK